MYHDGWSAVGLGTRTPPSPHSYTAVLGIGTAHRTRVGREVLPCHGSNKPFAYGKSQPFRPSSLRLISMYRTGITVDLNEHLNRWRLAGSSGCWPTARAEAG